MASSLHLLRVHFSMKDHAYARGGMRYNFLRFHDCQKSLHVRTTLYITWKQAAWMKKNYTKGHLGIYSYTGMPRCSWEKHSETKIDAPICRFTGLCTTEEKTTNKNEKKERARRREKVHLNLTLSVFRWSRRAAFSLWLLFCENSRPAVFHDLTFSSELPTDTLHKYISGYTRKHPVKTMYLKKYFISILTLNFVYFLWLVFEKSWQNFFGTVASYFFFKIRRNSRSQLNLKLNAQIPSEFINNQCLNCTEWELKEEKMGNSSHYFALVGLPCVRSFCSSRAIRSRLTEITWLWKSRSVKSMRSEQSQRRCY